MTAQERQLIRRAVNEHRRAAFEKFYGRSWYLSLDRLDRDLAERIAWRKKQVRT